MEKEKPEVRNFSTPEAERDYKKFKKEMDKKQSKDAQKIEEQLNKLDINEIITKTTIDVLPPIVLGAIEQIDTIEIEGKRVRIKFK